MVGSTRRSRLLMSTAAAAVLTGILISLAGTSSPPASGTGAAPDDRFAVVGDGSLPQQRPPLGAPRDPLSAEETGYAIALATRHSHLPTDSTDVRGAPGAEVLRAELAADTDSTGRIAVVQLYDYTSNSGLQQKVDLRTGEVTTRSHRHVQAPISTTEAEVAVQLAIDHRPKLEFVREFEEAQGTPLLSPDQVTPVVGTFVHDGSTPGARQCGTNRCAQLMLRAPSGAYLSTWQFVVDLSVKRVLAVNDEDPS